MQCHGNLNSSKMSHLSGQTLWLEDVAVDTFVNSSFGTVLMTLFQDLLTAPSWQTFTFLACGWTLARDRHTASQRICGSLERLPSSTFHASLCSSGAPSTTNAGVSGGRSSASRPSLSPRARSFASASTIQRRKKLGPRSKDSPVTATARAPPAKNTGRCGVALIGFRGLMLPRCPRSATHF